MALQTKTVSAAIENIENEALTIAGVKTFVSSPIIPAPTTDLQATTKKYVDDAIDTDIAAATISSILDYGTSASASTARAQTALHICYGSLSVAGSNHVHITNLPFTASTSYAPLAVVGENSTGDRYSAKVAIVSASEFIIYNTSSSAIVFHWFAIGT